MAMLEPMGRLGVRLTPEQIDALKTHPSPEVRDAILYYARILTLRYRDANQRPLIEEFTHDKTQQVRDHALAIANELRTSRWASAQ